MKKLLYWIFVILLIAIIIIQNNNNKPQPIDNSVESKIDSFYIVRDSIYVQIDTVYQQLNNNVQEYEEDLNVIVNNSDDENICFFLEYIESNRSRLDSLCRGH